MSASESSIDIQELSPGSRLRQAREKAGLTLERCSQRTLIPFGRLQALENDDYARVGVGTFVTGYTRTYARLLGLDPVPLVRQQEARLAAQAAEQAPVAPAPSVAMSFEVRKRPGSLFGPLAWLFLVALVLVAVAAVIGREVLTPAPKPLEPRVVPPLPADNGIKRLVLPQLAPSGEEAPTPVEAEPPQPEALLEDRDFGNRGEEDAGAVVVEETATPEVEAPQVAVETRPPTQLILGFSDDCWVEVTDATGKRIVARQAASGDNLQLFGQAPFDVTLGNALAVTMTVNGRLVDTTPPGSRRTLRLKVAEPAN